VKYKYKIGDTASFFYPPTEKEAKASGRKAQHIPKFRGPATITKVLSSSKSAFQINYEGRVYNRSVINLRPYTSSQPHNLSYGLQDDTTLHIGKFIAVNDNSADQNWNDHFHVAEIISIVNDIPKVWYYSTNAKNLKSAVWRKVYSERSTRLTNRVPTHINRLGARLTGDILDPDSILVHNIELTPASRLTSKSIRAINSKRLKHHRFGVTWAQGHPS